MNTLVLFDFDGTLYKKDSLLEFTKFSKGKIRFYVGLLMISPYLISMKLGVISNEKAKEKFIRYFFKGQNYDEFKSVSNHFSLHKIKTHLNQKLYKEFIHHIESKHTVYIVTASFSEWIEPWSSQFKVKVIGTKPEVVDNKITGNFSSKNCYGQEKVNRIKETLNIDSFDRIQVYGEGKGDVEMINLSK